jgi:hypothetical protein
MTPKPCTYSVVPVLHTGELFAECPIPNDQPLTTVSSSGTLWEPVAPVYVTRGETSFCT